MAISDLIKDLRKGLGLTQQEFAHRLGVKRSLIGAYEEGRAEPRLELLHKMTELGGITLDRLFNGKENANPVNQQFRNKIPLVPIKAAAGYLKGFDDPTVISELPLISIPSLGSGDYRAFEISGDSMLPIVSGSIIIGERLSELDSVKKGKTYIMVTKNDGVIFKRIEKVLGVDGELQLRSDNPIYTNYSISGDDILEVWQAKAVISLI
jgi:transcriptional regulator with XRE-family HTH domain